MWSTFILLVVSNFKIFYARFLFFWVWGRVCAVTVNTWKLECCKLVVWYHFPGSPKYGIVVFPSSEMGPDGINPALVALVTFSPVGESNEQMISGYWSICGHSGKNPKSWATSTVSDCVLWHLERTADGRLGLWSKCAKSCMVVPGNIRYLGGFEFLVISWRYRVSSVLRVTLILRVTLSLI